MHYGKLRAFVLELAGLPSAGVAFDGITGGVAADVGAARVGPAPSAASRAALAEHTAHLRTLTGVLAAVVAERRRSLTPGQLTVRRYIISSTSFPHYFS